MDGEQPACQRQIVRRFHRAAADKNQPVALGLDDAPAGAAQARVDAENTDGLANRWRRHGLVITPQWRERNIKRTDYPRFRWSCPGRCAARRTCRVGPSVGSDYVAMMVWTAPYGISCARM